MTEPQYFELFRHPRLQVKVLPTEEGKSAPKHVLRRLRAYRKEYEIGPRDELWLMVDVDRWGPRQLAMVAQQAVSGKFEMAVSNPCFELWLYLHLGDLDELSPGEITSTVLEGALRSRLGSFNKSRLDIERFRDGIEAAIDRARKLDVRPDERWPTTPGTQVYKVVANIRSASELTT